MDWNDPQARFALIERVGLKEYNRLIKEHLAKAVIETVNGHTIRVVHFRGCPVYMVDGMDRGSTSLEEARKIALGEVTT